MPPKGVQLFRKWVGENCHELLRRWWSPNGKRLQSLFNNLSGFEWVPEKARGKVGHRLAPLF
jgi:hypothetical protein